MMKNFYEAGIAAKLAAMSASEVDTLEFDVIGMDAQTIVRLYNAHEARYAGLAPARVLGQPLFTAVAIRQATPCCVPWRPA